MIFRAGLFALAMLLAAIGAKALRPHHYLTRQQLPINLAAQVPTAFSDWREVKDLVPLLPNPELESRLDAIYTQVLARTYINSAGQRVMLSIAYGNDQSSEVTAVHRPEFCYGAQGFLVDSRGTDKLNFGATTVPVQKLLARSGSRVEPILYWVTLDTTATLPGMGRKLQQLRYGLSGQIVDGMLVRVSSTNPNEELSEFKLQQRFVNDLYRAVPAELRSRYFGK
jgi:EpsI family protein